MNRVGYWNDEMIREYTTSAYPPELHGVAYVPEDRLPIYGPIRDSQIQPASLDVRLGGHFHTPFFSASGLETEIGPEHSYVLEPGDCVLSHLVEKVRIPNDALARIEGKSTWARKFLTVHSAGFIDPGFEGDVVLELKNDSPIHIPLTPGMVIAQISFADLAAPAVRPYGSGGLGSHYQSQSGATPART